MRQSEFKVIHRGDYRPPDFLVEAIDLCFRLDETKTTVRARSVLKRNPQAPQSSTTLTLHGEQLTLERVLIDGEELDGGRLVQSTHELQILEVAERFELDIVTTVNPAANTSLSGLYLSSSIFCTQCEAEGFRRITYYPDRPDVLTRFTTRIEADRGKYPVLLSNGNLVEEGRLGGGFHYALWHDPFPKPSYLFALVAGDLTAEQDTFLTRSGRSVDLYIYTEPRNRGTCGHAMRSLKKAMQWDEEVFGLEYDLDRYMIVAVDDFNMGAMENKGLNIFNSKYVLGLPETATDQDYLNIEGVIAHEYFHNWTGNRVTCRDWFQLSLKEGLTVFRDQEFSADMNSRPVQRIKDVRVLRQFQFREDEGPMAHPVRPDTYMEINNFYTVTVYNKGAEVVRMLHTLIGPELFRKGMDLYFARHDGQAVTCDDFVAAMAAASGRDLEQFSRWYSQAGTPHLTVRESWSGEEGRYQLTLRQHTPQTPGQPVKLPFHLPVLIGLLDQQGRDLVAALDTTCEKRGDSLLLELTGEEQRFEFTHLPCRPTLSLLRAFSAPVKIEPARDRASAALLMAHDPDLFNRWEVSTALSGELITELAAAIVRGERPRVERSFVEAVSTLLTLDGADDSLTALALQLPEEAYLALAIDEVDPDLLHRARVLVKEGLGRQLHDVFLDCYLRKDQHGPYSISPEAVGARSLKNVCLDYLLSGNPGDPGLISLAGQQYRGATNMTDRIAVLAVVANLDIGLRDELFGDFQKRWRDNPLVMDKWFTLQALSQCEDTYERVVGLRSHPAFSIRNPNKVRALVGAFCQNHYHFHHSSGRGYEFLVDVVVELDPLNPQVAARMATPLISWKRYESGRRAKMIASLEKIGSRATLSRDLFEIVSRGLERA